jgi:hypothetical protein
LASPWSSREVFYVRHVAAFAVPADVDDHCQLAAVSFLARDGAHTHDLYSYQLRRWFEWCEGNGLPHFVLFVGVAERRHWVDSGGFDVC